MSDTITYRSYLGLPDLLACQRPLTDARDELLFISIHQASEIWLKLTLHELRAARAQVIADDLSPAFKMMARVARIQAQLIQSWGSARDHDACRLYGDARSARHEFRFPV